MGHKRIAIFKGAAIMFDDDMKKKGIVVDTNTGPQVDEVDATGANIKKYMKDKKYPPIDKQ